MQKTLKTLAVIAALTTAATGPVLAETKAFTCPSGYTLHSGICHPNSSQGPALAPFSSASADNATCPLGYVEFFGACYPAR